RNSTGPPTRARTSPIITTSTAGMLEHVGVAFYDTYFLKCAKLLADDGIMLLHSIGRSEGPNVASLASRWRPLTDSVKQSQRDSDWSRRFARWGVNQWIAGRISIRSRLNTHPTRWSC